MCLWHITIGIESTPRHNGLFVLIVYAAATVLKRFVEEETYLISLSEYVPELLETWLFWHILYTLRHTSPNMLRQPPSVTPPPHSHAYSYQSAISCPYWGCRWLLLFLMPSHRMALRRKVSWEPVHAPCLLSLLCSCLVTIDMSFPPRSHTMHLQLEKC